MFAFNSDHYSIHGMDIISYFINPTSPAQKQYEALKAFYVDGYSAIEAAQKFNFSPSYFKKLRYEFSQTLKSDQNPFFPIKKTGPKSRFTDKTIIEEIVALRKKNHSILDIKTILDAKTTILSLDTIDNILKGEGFAPLPKRTRVERLSVEIPKKIEAPQSVLWKYREEEFTTDKGIAPLLFLPLIEKLGIIEAIKKADFPKTSVLSDVSSILSLLALKLIGNEGLSHDTTWNFDRALGLFAKLNVLPKNSTLSSYSYRVSRRSNRNFLISLSNIFKGECEEGEFNLDFKAIPHWGDASILDKNWSGSRNKAIKSILSLIVQDPTTGFLSYTDATVKKPYQQDAGLDFVDFWKEGRAESPKMLIFDSKFTTYENLNKLNKSKEKIKFITLRRRGKNLVDKVNEVPEHEWQMVRVEGEKRKINKIRVHDGYCKLRKYEGEIRQVILTEHGRKQPTFLITNDFNMELKEVIRKYARRWLVEQEIAEQIAFFHLNQPSSSLIIKVDFDLTLSLLAHNLYRVLTNQIPGFERCTVQTICRNFLENGGSVKIKNNEVIVYLKKKSHLPSLMQLQWLNEKTKISWLGIDIIFKFGTTS